MEIIIKDTVNKVPFSNLTVGTVFIWNGVPYMKVIGETGGLATAVNLDTSQVTAFLVATKVLPKTNSVLEVK